MSTLRGVISFDDKPSPTERDCVRNGMSRSQVDRQRSLRFPVYVSITAAGLRHCSAPRRRLDRIAPPAYQREMQIPLVMTIIGPDRPGLVELLASLVAEHGGNWLESRMSHLAGQF